MTEKLTKKQKAVDALFKPNKNGVSEWKSRDIIQKVDTLNWGKNGFMRNGLCWGDDRYIWEKYPKSGKILKIKINGLSYNKSHNKNRPIGKNIREFYKKQSCVICGSNSDIVPDHKNDLYNDKFVLNIKTQLFDDFQSLCNHCNLQKRQANKKFRQTGIKYGATNIPSLKMWGVDFIPGLINTNDEKIDLTDPLLLYDTYWYDIVEFNTYLSVLHKPFELRRFMTKRLIKQGEILLRHSEYSQC